MPISYVEIGSSFKRKTMDDMNPNTGDQPAGDQPNTEGEGEATPASDTPAE